jgi:hypothetical protein
VKLALSLLGALTSLGFLLASAVINYTFGYRLGRSAIDQYTLAAVAILAVAFNALSPFFLQWAKTPSTKAATILIWCLCLLYTVASAAGFAAENRAATTGARSAQHDNLQTTKDMLADELGKKRKDYRRITQLRQRIMDYRSSGANVEPDSQATLISRITTLPEQAVRTTLTILFALLIEICAALGLYASIAHLEFKAKPKHLPKPELKIWKRKSVSALDS